MADVLVLGSGVSGQAAEALAKKLGLGVVTLADDARDAVPAGEFAYAITSPGVALSHPWQAACRARGIRVVSELQFGCEELRRRGVKLLAVTGSKGKSSVVKAVAGGLAKAGAAAVPCGNYGTPVSAVALTETLPAWAVVEVSSFMLETTDLPSDAFEAAAILNLQEDHLDRHGSVAAYHALKRRLLGMAKVRLDFSDVRSMADLRKRGLEDVAEFSAGSYFDNEILVVNGVAAAELMAAAGLDEAAIRRAFSGFEPLPHRMNRIAEIGGVEYVDDSKATSLAALEAGVRMASSVRLIAGGLPKGDDPKSVLPTLTNRVRKVYLIGQSAEEFFKAWSAAVDCEICGTLDRAVEKARCEAVKGDTVLLSPGTASFDQFKSFEQRGEVFARLVNK